MSINRIVLPALAIGSVLGVVAIATARRERPGGPELAPNVPLRKVLPGLEPAPPREEPDEVAATSEVAADDIVLPLAFWDAAAELDPEDELPLATHALGLSEEPYDSIAVEDASTTWLSRATQAPARSSDAIDDPAEIAADSMSMVSEASRHAAADPSASSDSGPESAV